ncbi:MAG: Omp28-related outer membrane protein [Bacteroidota bacterium]|nr:Omp28-related outer membrane protein [Bacteroidota bacterium]
MEKSIQFLLFTVLIAALTTQCDVINQPFKNSEPQDTTSTAQLRNVLIEDWTGHRCKNCPKASKVIENLIDSYGSERIIGLAVHGRPSSFTGTTPDYPNDFTTPEAKALQNFFFGNSPPLPIGMLNRENWTSTGNGHLSGRDDWPTLSAEAMDSSLRIAIEASASINSGQLNVSAEGFPQTSLLHDLNIIVLVKESNIISPQLMPDNTRDTDYVHMNVLRDYVTDTWGTSFGTSPMVPGDTINGTYSLTWNTDWVKSNSAVVVYVYNPINYRVLQVVEVGID